MTLTAHDMSLAADNATRAAYVLRNTVTGEERVFELKDLPYKDYTAFCSLAAPIFETLVGGLEPVLTPAEPSTLPDGSPLPGAEMLDAVARIGMENLDLRKLIALAENELPKLAHLVAKQSDPKITEDELMRLARRPHVLLEMILAQMEVNNIVKEFADFFPLLAKRFGNVMNGLSETKTEATE